MGWGLESRAFITENSDTHVSRQPEPRLQWSGMWWGMAVIVGRLLSGFWGFAGWR